MPRPIRLALVLHDHQPVGNFDYVFEQAYQESYRPFLDVFSRYPSLKICLHTSGSLMEWLDLHHSDYVDRLAELVVHGRVEILGGAFYEAILAMIPSRDRIGQITSYRHWLEKRLGGAVRGMWMPERVWEQSFTRDLATAGVEYTVLDDFHFRNAGLVESQLDGHYITEDDGQVLSVFPGSERLRYTIPFRDPQETIDYLASISQARPDAIAVFGDDGEKFGTWPGTHQHCYNDRWLERFFDAIVANQDWIQVTTLAEAVDNVPPLGKVYLPDSSYREMTEWVLPAEQQSDYQRVIHEMEHDSRWPALRRFVRGGFWRNFKVRYPESDEMYARMMQISRRLEQSRQESPDSDLMEEAQRELYRGQCNCGYWHGAFGGIYLPHLRNAVYHHLITAENLLERSARQGKSWIEVKAEDLNFDARQEVSLGNDKLLALFAPSEGGRMYELDVRSIGHNLLATMTRRPEAYHRKVIAGNNGSSDACASIHDRIVCKQEGLDQRIHYDGYLRKSLVDLFYDANVGLDTVASGQAADRGNFSRGIYETRLRRNPERVQVQMSRSGEVFGKSLRLSKAITLDAGSSKLEIAYLIENLSPGDTYHFAVELNFAGLPAGADDRYFYGDARRRLGQLGTRLDQVDVRELGLVDEWLGIDVGLHLSRPSHLWAFPIESVSQSEGGFELVHQSVAVVPHWYVEGDAEGRWGVTLELALDTSRADARAEQRDTVAAF